MSQITDIAQRIAASACAALQEIKDGREFPAGAFEQVARDLAALPYPPTPWAQDGALAVVRDARGNVVSFAEYAPQIVASMNLRARWEPALAQIAVTGIYIGGDACAEIADKALTGAA